MANQELIELLFSKDTGAYDRWCKNHPNAEKDFSEADLERADLSGVDFTRANLRKARLKNADLLGANLQQACLEGADLEGASLLEALLCSANLDSANLTEAQLLGASLDEASLRGANLANVRNLARASLFDVTWEGVQGINKTTREIIELAQRLTQAAKKADAEELERKNTPR